MIVSTGEGSGEKKTGRVVGVGTELSDAAGRLEEGNTGTLEVVVAG